MTVIPDYELLREGKVGEGGFGALLVGRLRKGSVTRKGMQQNGWKFLFYVRDACNETKMMFYNYTAIIKHTLYLYICSNKSKMLFICILVAQNPNRYNVCDKVLAHKSLLVWKF